MVRIVNKMNKKHGFTLIELLIVVAIIGILAAIAVPNFMNARTRATVARVYSDIKALAMAQEMYFLDNNCYPPESEDNPYSRPRTQQGLFFLTSPISYIASIPDDPFVPKSKLLEDGARHVYETGVPRAKGGKYMSYMIFSVGPDASENGLYSEHPFVLPQRNGGESNTYASSNGLKSNGDIYWYGGDCSITANLIVDGKTYNGSCPPNFRN